MISGIFITGTGTGVGKTIVTAGVLRWMRAHSVQAMVMKPVQTGAAPGLGGRLSAPDLDEVLRAANLAVDEETRAHLSPYLFAPACSPHLAARTASQPITMDHILSSARWLAARHELLLVEGAGGLMVPLNERQTMLDLIAALAMPVLLVSHSGLGAINHALLSLQALRQRRLRVLGVILNDIEPVPEHDGFIHEDNAHAIESFGDTRILARIPYLGEQPAACLNALDAALAGCDFLSLLKTQRRHELGSIGVES